MRDGWRRTPNRRLCRRAARAGSARSCVSSHRDGQVRVALSWVLSHSASAASSFWTMWRWPLWLPSPLSFFVSLMRVGFDSVDDESGRARSAPDEAGAARISDRCPLWDGHPWRLVVSDGPSPRTARTHFVLNATEKSSRQSRESAVTAGYEALAHALDAIYVCPREHQALTGHWRGPGCDGQRTLLTASAGRATADSYGAVEK